MFPSVQIKKMKFLKPSAEFRDVWQYDNSMYTMLSYLPTLVLPSKVPFARYVKEHIFDPLGMSSTTYSYDVAKASGQLADGLTKQGNLYGNSTANGTLRALPFWAQTGGEDGNCESIQIFPEMLIAYQFITAQSGPGGVISTAVDMVRTDQRKRYKNAYAFQGDLAANTVAQRREARNKYFSNPCQCNRKGGDRN
jgi:CubicO group peptidase (beta-lactamase class C family)